jgi:hypothetical protein
LHFNECKPSNFALWWICFDWWRWFDFW